MSPQAPVPVGCAAMADHLAELALGVAPGRQRAEVLAHLDHCDRCRAELEQLTLAADGILRAAPSMAPPPGFAARVVAQMTAPPGAAAPRRRRPAARRRALLAAAAVLVVLAAGLGVGLAHRGGAPGGDASEVQLASGPLMAHGRVAGTVATYAGRAGKSPWLEMSLHLGRFDGWVRCQVTVGGDVVTLGRFWVHDGTGSWASALPAAARVTGAAVVGPDWRTMATADLRT